MTLPPVLLGTIVAACALLFPAAPAAAQSPMADDARSIESGRDALSKSSGFPWYDDEADGVRSIDVRPPKPPPRPREWVPPTFNAPNAPSWNWGKIIWNVMRFILWATFAALVIWLIVVLTRAAIGRTRERQAAFDDDAPKETTDADRIEKLPFQIDRPKSDLLGSAEQCYREGNFAEAIIYLFSHQLLQLDKNHLIRLTKGKTNRQYLREIRQHRRVLDLVRETMVPFEDVFFGDHSLGRSRFEACWGQLDEFHNLVQQGRA